MKKALLTAMTALILAQAYGKNLTYEFPLENGCGNYSPKMTVLTEKIKKEAGPSDNVTVRFEKGTYIFRSEGTACISGEWKAAMDFSGIGNLTVDGRGAEFLFEGRMTPIVAKGCSNLTLKLFTVDFLHPHTLQFEIVNNLGDGGMVIYLAPWTLYDIDKDGRLVNCGEGWRSVPCKGTVFDSRDRRIVYRLPEKEFDTRGSDSLENRIIESPDWKDTELRTGMVVTAVMPEAEYPGICIADSKDVRVEFVTVHYAENCGLLAQGCENIALEGFRAALKEKGGQRYFTTGADATRFIGCSGKISSKNGLYENMNGTAMDVRNACMKVSSISADRKTITGQCPPYSWKDGDSVLTAVGRYAVLSAAYDGNTATIILDNPASTDVSEGCNMYGTNRLPLIEFTGNTIRNCNTCGIRISTQRGSVIEENLFTNISGCAAILDGSSRNVRFKGNRFIDVMTSEFSSQEAIITILPASGKSSGITIEGNYFETFDRPVVFASDVDGLQFTKNLVYGDTRHKPFHSNSHTFSFIRTKGYDISGNTYSGYSFDEKKDMYVEP